MDRLTPVLFHDAWGSRIAIPGLQGRPIPANQPESELWMGAHEAGPSGLIGSGGATLLDAIRENPTRVLGARCVARYGPRLPFLLKILAPAQAISIQVHPSADQAAQLRGPDGDGSVYVDDWGKPELLVAVSPFEVFIGTRQWADIEITVRRLGVPALVAMTEDAAADSEPIRALMRSILSADAVDQADLVHEVVMACVEVEGDDDGDGDLCAAVAQIAEEHPNDIGLVVLLLMNHRVLHPGEYIDVPAGVLHSYVRGLGVEVLANSDNVVRAGLTIKEVNATELLRIVDPAADGRVGSPTVVASGVELFASSSDRFVLHRIRPTNPILVPGEELGPRIVFCLRGEVLVRADGEEIALGHTESVFIPAGTGTVTVQGTAEVYAVSVPELGRD